MYMSSTGNVTITSLPFTLMARGPSPTLGNYPPDLAFRPTLSWLGGPQKMGETQSQDKMRTGENVSGRRSMFLAGFLEGLGILRLIATLFAASVFVLVLFPKRHDQSSVELILSGPLALVADYSLWSRLLGVVCLCWL